MLENSIIKLFIKLSYCNVNRKVCDHFYWLIRHILINKNLFTLMKISDINDKFNKAKPIVDFT